VPRHVDALLPAGIIFHLSRGRRKRLHEQRQDENSNGKMRGPHAANLESPARAALRDLDPDCLEDGRFAFPSNDVEPIVLEALRGLIG
jgi:hypothetical protein